MSAIRRAYYFWCTLLVTALWAANSLAGPKVVLLPADSNDQLLAEALVRLEKELAAVGFDVVIGPTPVHEPKDDLEVAATSNVMAAIALVRTDDQGTVEVWVLDRLTGKTVIRTIHIALNSEKAPTILAIRTTEVLRASLLEATTAPPPDMPTTPVPDPVSQMVSPTSLEPFSPLFLSIGGSALVDAGIAPTGDVTIRAGRGIAQNIALRVSVMASVFPQVVTRTEGKASIQQQVGTFDAVWTPFGPSHVVPFLVAGVGVERAEVDGADVATGYLGQDVQSWAFAANLGIGASIRLSDRIWWLFDGYAQIAVPQLRVQVNSQSVGLLGAPNWLFGTHLQITL